MTNAIKNLQGNRVLIAPLDWGLGHATRCIPILQALINCKKKVIIAAYGNGAKLLREEFPEIEIIEFKGLNIHYSDHKSHIFTLLRQLPKAIESIRTEHREIKQIINKYKIDTLISDNRFGLWGSGAYSIYITHQIMIKCPWWLKIGEPIGWLIHRSIIKRYNECWIPDHAGNDNLSGDLAHKYPLPRNAKFIGPLSRFSNNRETLNILWEKIKHNIINIGLIENYNNLVIISGPEPHRTKMEKWAIDKFHNSENKTLLVCGLPNIKEKTTIQKGNITIVNHLQTDTLKYYLLKTKSIYCRSGYTTIMDLYTLGVTATQLIPTPGQTEQEYLYKFHKK